LFEHHLPIFLASGCSAPSGICVQINQVLEEVDSPVNGEKFLRTTCIIGFSSRAFLVCRIFCRKGIEILENLPLEEPDLGKTNTQSISQKIKIYKVV
jgi:hypothetical protein